MIFFGQGPILYSRCCPSPASPLSIDKYSYRIYRRPQWNVSFVITTLQQTHDFSDGRTRNAETCWLLLNARADANYRESWRVQSWRLANLTNKDDGYLENIRITSDSRISTNVHVIQRSMIGIINFNGRQCFKIRPVSLDEVTRPMIVQGEANSSE